MIWSYWEKDTFIKTPDVTIIGSGIVGLNAAYSLKIKNPSLHILVLERGILPYGASTKNAGFACFGSISELLADLSTTKEEDVFNLVHKRFLGLKRLREILGDENIGYEALGGYEIFSEEQTQLANKCLNAVDKFNTELSRITEVKNTYQIVSNKISSFNFHGVNEMILNTQEGQIHTGLMMKALLEKCRLIGIEILNGVDVKEIKSDSDGVTIQIENNLSIVSKNVLIATNGFANSLIAGIDVRPARAQVLITNPIPGLKLKGSFHYDEGYYYFRNVGERVLIGGGRNLDFAGESTTEFGLTDKIQNSLEDLLTKMILPNTNFTIDQRWSGIMGLGSNKTPIIQKVEDHIYCCVRMGGMGIAIGSLVGQEAAEMITKSI